MATMTSPTLLQGPGGRRVQEEELDLELPSEAGVRAQPSLATIRTDAQHGGDTSVSFARRSTGSDSTLSLASQDAPAHDGSEAGEDVKLPLHSTCYQGCRQLTHGFLDTGAQAPAAVKRIATVYQLTWAVVIIVLFIADSTTAPTETSSAYWRAELTVAAVWGAEYLLRLWSCVEASHCPPAAPCRARWREARRPMMILDLVSLISLAVDLRIESNAYRGVVALRMLRLLTLYRIERDFRMFGPVLTVLYDMKAQLVATLGIAALTLSVASVIMYYIEAPSNPKFDTVLKSMWWGTTALTTVGYGDAVPETGAGRVVASIVAFMGTGLFGLFAGILAEGFREAWRRDRRFHRKKHSSAKHDCADGWHSPISGQAVAERLRRHEEEMGWRFENLEHQVSCLRAEVRETTLLLHRIACQGLLTPGRTPRAG